MDPPGPESSRPSGNEHQVKRPTTSRFRYLGGTAFGRSHVFETRAGSWQLSAACRGEDSAYFFAPSYFEKRHEKDAREAVAKAICQTCPVLEECREFALRARESHGIWGGLNEMERRAFLREHRSQAG